mmetsp:Transcript_13468/g.18450  ORF Transcript_13468/g.18450 Transcript_13468/m.18450 type:complete len:211 (+) Transcript_13468:1032-1664(+)
MRLCEGGNLAEKLKANQEGLPEEQVKYYFRSLISALHHCLKVHEISHRDIKPENIMLDNSGQVHLTDFGCSEFFEPSSNDLSKATKGTYLFMAPEMLQGDKSKKIVKGPPIDIWAAGVTLFNLLTNRYPWEGKQLMALAEKIKNDPPDFDLLGPGRADLKELLEKVFNKNPLERIDIYDLVDHAWVTDNGVNLVDLDMELTDSVSLKQLS